MAEYYRNERISFRIVGLEGGLLDDYKKCIGTEEFRATKYKDTSTFVVTFPIEKKRNFNGLIEFINQYHIDENIYGIYVSLVTESDHDGVSLPRHVVELHKKIGGHLDFSFTCV